jgi:hypothetical protein
MTDTDALRAELASLRWQVRILALGLVGALVLAGLSYRSARRAAPDQPDVEPGVLVGQSLYLGDLNGPTGPYVRLRYLHRGGGLILSDDEGHGRVQLLASSEGGKLLLGSPPRLALDATDRTSLVVRDDGSRDRLALRGGSAPRLVLLDEAGRARLELSASREGGKISLYGADGRELGVWGQQGKAVRLRLRDAGGKVVFEAPR